MRDRTVEIVLRQAQAMDTKLFEVGLFKPTASAEMLLGLGISSTDSHNHSPRDSHDHLPTLGRMFSNF